jgi:hypothetical protein
MTAQYILRASLCRPAHCVGEYEQKHGGAKRFAESEIENLGWAPDYAEPGYTAGKRGVLTANWNYFPSRIDKTLEQAGFSIEWSDEWATCEDCGKLVRTTGDCWGWQPAYVMQGECTLVCLDCVDWGEYLESIEDNPQSACMRACNPAQHGYALISKPAEFENGFHPGQNDNPKEILEQLHKDGKRGIVFRISETGQFDISFETWQKIAEERTKD